MANWLLLIICIFIPVRSFIWGRKQNVPAPKAKVDYYLGAIVFQISLLLYLFLLDPITFSALDFSIVGKGFQLDEAYTSVFWSVFTLPFVFAFTSLGDYYPKDITQAKELFGYPIALLPDRYNGLFLFLLYIVVGVVFEEMLCRQVLFYALNETLHLRGDAILLVTALVFSLGHAYQGVRGLVSSFIIGLLLGKTFQMTEHICYPILQHLIFNLTIFVLAFRRIRDLNKAGLNNV